ncbi:MAG: D-alanyl-D-alanine carboxypeptidase, partial [Oscillospiraceae bacterium]|nr:D-alanyl-D-alanine carboxypeptidase [Oscillospiraceae bacterium]
VNTHGLPNDNHYTTPMDFALIALEASRHELFMEICSTPTITSPPTNLSGERTLKNSNALISTDGIYGSGYLYQYANGMKTGHTNAAGYCLISTAEKDGIELLAAVFGGAETWPGPTPAYTNFSDSITLYEWVFTNFAYREVLRSTDAVAKLDVEMGSNADSVSLRPESSISALVPNDSDLSEFRLSVSYDHGDSDKPLMAPISAGQKLGEVTLTKNGINYGTVNLVAASGVDLSRGEYLKSQIQATTSSTAFKLIFWVVILILVAYVILVVSYRIRRARHRKAVRQAKLEQARRERIEREELERQAMQQRADNPAIRPAVSYIPEKSPEQQRKEQAERDYFEEFFKNN